MNENEQTNETPKESYLLIHMALLFMIKSKGIQLPVVTVIVTVPQMEMELGKYLTINILHNKKDSFMTL